MKKKPPSYSGVLIEPIERRGWEQKTLLGPGFDSSAEYQLQFDDRIAALFSFYKIDASAPDAWQTLAVALARAHVGGFSVRPSSRRSDSWTPRRLMELRAAVNFARSRNADGTLASRRRDVLPVCKELYRSEQKPKVVQGLTADRMRRLYYEASALRRLHLRIKLSRWAPSSTIFLRRPNLRHPWWQKRILEGDPEALRWLERQTAGTLLQGHVKVSNSE